MDEFVQRTTMLTKKMTGLSAIWVLLVSIQRDLDLELITNHKKWRNTR
jgi:hypothetical protein